MGAEITIIHNPSSGWEPSGKIIIAGRKLCATDIAAAEIPGLIDEIPALAAAMAFAEGESSVTGASELRNKESDRIKILTTNFRKAGIVCDELSDGFKIRGSSSIPGSIELDPADDHRLAMTFAILDGRSQNGLAIKNSDCVKISFPTFFSLFKRCSQG
jgi:3-phosphoshikimate 1-carboxyvinyltransferase